MSRLFSLFFFSFRLEGVFFSRCRLRCLGGPFRVTVGTSRVREGLTVTPDFRFGPGTRTPTLGLGGVRVPSHWSSRVPLVSSTTTRDSWVVFERPFTPGQGSTRLHSGPPSLGATGRAGTWRRVSYLTLTPCPLRGPTRDHWGSGHSWVRVKGELGDPRGCRSVRRGHSSAGSVRPPVGVGTPVNCTRCPRSEPQRGVMPSRSST